MSKYRVGDKFVIEIAECLNGAESGYDRYRIKGFDNLIFDDKGLKRLENYDLDARAQEAYNTAWKRDMNRD